MSKGWSVLSGRWVQIALVVLFTSIAVEAPAMQVVGASAAPPTLIISPHGNLSDGQTISLSVGPNSYFTPHAGVKILECADPGGSVANLPKDDTTCDGNTIQGSTILVQNDGSFSESAYPVYLLPSSALGEQSNYKPVCNQSNPCVLYVGQNQNDFTVPKVLSAPFLITQGSGNAATTTTAVASTSSNGSSSTTSTTAAPASSSSATGAAVALPTPAATVPSPGLANTGPPAKTPWIVLSGMALLLTGAVGRRLSLRRGR